MKIFNVFALFTLVLCSQLTLAQEQSSTQSIATEIEKQRALLDSKEKELKQAESFLKELKESDPENALIDSKTKKVDALKLEILELKSTLFELNEQLKKAISVSETKPATLTVTNQSIISNYSSEETDTTSKSWIHKDIRNPITFTEFIIRNPRANGKDVLTKPSNTSSYNYIKPGSIINILFNKNIYDKLETGVELTVSAYLKRFDGAVVPITVSGFFDVKVETDQAEFENNIVAKVNKTTPSLVYNYIITSTTRGPIQAEINTSMANPQPKDKLIITVINVSDGDVSFTTTFEYEDFGWETSASGGFAWVNTIRQGNSNFKPAGSSGMSFHYKLDKGSSFFYNFINPSFGPELLVLQDASQNTNVGLGLSVSTFLRTVKVGYGWYLVGENGRPYVSIGVNFIEGYKSISSILSRGQE